MRFYAASSSIMAVVEEETRKQFKKCDNTCANKANSLCMPFPFSFPSISILTIAITHTHTQSNSPFHCAVAQQQIQRIAGAFIAVIANYSFLFSFQRFQRDEFTIPSCAIVACRKCTRNRWGAHHTHIHTHKHTFASAAPNRWIIQFRFAVGFTCAGGGRGGARQLIDRRKE